MIPKLTVYAKYLYYLMVLIVEITCFSQDVQLLSACSDKFLGIHMNDRIFANQNTENPLNFTIQSHHYPSGPNMAPDIRITFFLRERGAYICFTQSWKPRLMKKKNLKDERMCHFREQMDGGYFTFSSVEDPKKYLAFMRNGRPVNYASERGKNDERCRRIYKRITEESSNNNEIFSTAGEHFPLTTAPTAASRKSSSRAHQKTHSKRIDMTKPRSTSRAKAHPVRHHHNELPLRHPHQHQQQQHQQQQQSSDTNNDNLNNPNTNNFNTNANYNNNNNNNINYNSYNARNNNPDDNDNEEGEQQQVGGNANPNNVIYSDPSNDKSVNSNNISDNHNDKVAAHHHIRHQRHRKPQQQQQQQQTFSRPSNFGGAAQEQQQEQQPQEQPEEMESGSNCPSDDSDADKHLPKGKKTVRGRNNAHANEKQQSSKCNNRKTRKNNENVRHSRKSSQKTSHKTNRTPEN